MDSKNLNILYQIISSKGWLNLLTVVKSTLEEYFPLKELIEDKKKYVPTQKKLIEERPERNPYDKNCFKSQKFDPFLGFFTPSTFRKAFIELYSDSRTIKIGKPPNTEIVDIKSKLYCHYKTSDYKKKIAVTSYMAATKLLNDPDYGNGTNVLPIINGLVIGLLPDLKLATGNFGQDSFGVHWYQGDFDYIFIKEQISDEVLTDFENHTRKKIESHLKKIVFPKSETVGLDILMEAMLTTITLIHELGHRLDRRCLKNQKEEIHYFWMKYKEKAEVSKYSVRNAQEWLAETWTAWVIDGLSYNANIKANFLRILFPPKVEVKEKLDILKKETSGYSEFTWKNLRDLLIKEKMSPGTNFRIQVTYDIGPALDISGTLVSVLKSEIPSLKYEDERGIKTLNFFPNRKIVSIDILKI